ncbi:MAG TPA: DUF4214 domain-containing protein, partial [Pirellulales bacterium]|nr:DUF4214 domain-containing protein [Pirellulales bacterium]
EPILVALPNADFNISSVPGLASLLQRANVIHFSAGEILANSGRVTVDEFEPIEFANQDALTIDAGAGNDDVVLNYATATNAPPTSLQTITINGNDGDDQMTAISVPVPDGTPAGFQRVRLFGNAGNDHLDASAVTLNTPFTLDGGDGNDTLAGGSGAAIDQYIGGPGDDLFVYTPGNDSYEGDAGVDTLLVNGSSGNDVLTLNQTAITTMVVSRSLAGGSTQTSTNDVGRTLEIVRVEAGDGDDLIAISVSDSLVMPGPPDVDKGSLAFRVIGGGPNGSDRLNVRDDGQGDLVVHRQAADGHSGSIRVGPFQPVDYEGIEFVDITPLDPVTGRTGNDGSGTPNGQLVVFHADQLESNPSRLVATPLGGAPTFIRDLNIDPGPVDLPQPFDPLPGDEDWYEFRPPKIGTYRFETLFQQIPTLPSGRQGLPGNGNLQIEVRSASGALIDSLNNTDDNKSLMISMAANTSYFLRVRGVGNAINVYDLNITEVDLLGPQVFDPDGPGGVGAVHITDDPSTPADESLYDLSTQKGAGLTSPTPLITSLTVHLRDPLTPTLLVRQPGDVYPALDAAVASQPGLYVLVGDSVGRIPISNVIVTNNPVAAGEIATATVVLQFAKPLPDDRYTLTILDSLTDPPGNREDGESNSSEPQSPFSLPSGNGISGGPFQERFTVDSRPEMAYYAGLTVVADMNGNGLFDLANPDAVNRDMQFLFGETSDQRFAGKLAPTLPGFDVLAAYGRVNGTWRFLIDRNGNGGLDPGESIVSPAQVNALAVAGNFDGNLANGDEIALFDGVTWRILSNDLGSVVATFDAGLRGYPIAGDFDGDGITDLGTFQNDQFFFNFGNDGFGNGVQQLVNFGSPGVKDRPVAADMDGDGITDIGIWVPNSGTDQGTAEWRFIISNDLSHAKRVTGSTNTLIHPFSPLTLGNDLVFHLGDPTALPLVGNFDPPVTATPAVTTGSSNSAPAGGSSPVLSFAAHNQVFVASLYHDLLGRAADLSGLNYYTERLNAGATRDSIVQTISSSREYLGRVVDSFYQTYLHRNADPGGRDHWIDVLQNGASEDSVATSFMLSAEYTALHNSNQNFVDALYQDVLSRSADPAGRASHLDSLSNGQTRSEAIASFLSSNERYNKVVDQLYSQYLGRHADTTGLAFYVDKLKNSPATARSLAQTLLSSDEYFATH